MTGVPIDFDPTAASRVRGARSEAELQKAARQLEGVFINILFEEMAKTVDKSNSLFGKAAGADMYDSWFRSEIAKSWSANGGTGLGDAIARSLGSKATAKTIAPPVHGGPGPAKPVPTPLRSASPHGALRLRDVTPQKPELPVAGRITSEYGERVHPVTGARHVHHGVDIAVPVGTPIQVPFAGRVKRVGHEGPMGHHVVVEHANGYQTVYAHASKVLVEPGQEVAAGEVLAESGNSGRSTGPHLHFSLLRDGKPVDPTRWMKPQSLVSGR